ncbi:MAG: hypothetical protein J6P87_03560 [Lachnospiraceae bacterium]|nr:hypothetical protein [Lachnospiraceae bacterium]
MEKQTKAQSAPAGTAQSPAPKREILTRRERRRRYKAVKREEREALKERLRYAPALKRLWMLYLWKPVAAVLAAAVICALLYRPVMNLIGNIVFKMYYETKDLPLSEEDLPKLYELSPIDEEGAERIAAYPAVGADETWTVCVYIVASDLEDLDENDLSYLTGMMTKEAAAENGAGRRARRMEHLTRFSEELEEKGLELPAFFFYPEKPVASSTIVTEDVTVADRPGAASTDIKELTAGVWSDNISVVIQTGGATRWSNQMVNPNRTQRFLYKGGVFKEVSDLPLAPASESDTLADFLRFCKDEYPADHTMLVLWNHGGGPFGYGHDSIFDGMFSLKDIRAALSDVYTPDRDDPAFDIIGFDACLMSCIEVTHALDGFAQFYCLSEESIPNNGWDYTPILQAMTDDASMSPARVAQTVADSYMDFYMRENVNQHLIQMDATFSVIEAKKAVELYEAYGDLCKAQLQDAVSDLGVLAEIGRCAGRSTHYADTASDIFNLIDLGNYMDQLGDSYPEECGRVKELIGEAVLYHRESGGLCDSTGIAAYVPGEVSSLNSLLYFLDYIYDVSDDESAAALYYYKQAGCLNDGLKEYASQISGKEPKVLNTAAFRQFSAADPEYDDIGFLLPVSEELQDLIVSYELETGKYDESSNSVTDYGRNNCLVLDGDGHLASEFDGRWICMDGQPLYLEVNSSAPSATEFISPVLYNGRSAYLVLTRDLDTDEICITGVRRVPGNSAADVNYLINTRSNEEIEFGSKITPVYQKSDFSDNSLSNVYGKQITFGRNTRLEMEALPAGEYLSTAVITDPRGDSYYSAVMASTLERGEMKDWRTDPRFFGRDYN